MTEKKIMALSGRTIKKHGGILASYYTKLIFQAYFLHISNETFLRLQKWF